MGQATSYSAPTMESLNPLTAVDTMDEDGVTHSDEELKESGQLDNSLEENMDTNEEDFPDFVEPPSDTEDENTQGWDDATRSDPQLTSTWAWNSLNLPSQSQTLFFMDLPVEIRHHILSFTSLVFREHSDSIMINHGTIGVEVEEDFNVHSVLSVPNKTFNADEHFVLFSKNRFVLLADAESALSVLQKNDRWLECIRHIEFSFRTNILEDWTTDVDDDEEEEDQDLLDTVAVADWNELVALIGDHFNLPALTIRIDAWHWEDLLDQGVTLMEVYEAIIQPLKGFGGKGLKNFVSVWGSYDYTDVAQRAVMGEASTEDDPAAGNTSGQ